MDASTLAPDQVAQRFMRGVRNPDGRQVSGAVQNGQLLRVAPVGLNSLAGLARDQRRRNHHASVAERGELAMDAVPAAARFVAEVELPMLCKSLGHLRNSLGCVRDYAEEPDRP